MFEVVYGPFVTAEWVGRGIRWGGVGVGRGRGGIAGLGGGNWYWALPNRVGLVRSLRYFVQIEVVRLA